MLVVIGIPRAKDSTYKRRIKIFKFAIILFRFNFDSLQTDALKASAAIT